MKKATKFGCSLLALACAVTSMGTLVGCKKTPDTDQTLEVKLAFSGYGVDFAKNMLDGFQKQDWVKAKYPNLEVIIKEDIDTAGVLGTIAAGAKNNTADLIFSSANAYAYFDKTNSDDGKYYIEDLHDVFYATVPGEDVLVKDKMLDAVEQGCAPTIIEDAKNEKHAGYKKYQFIPGQAGTNGLYVNLTYLRELTKATGVDYIGTNRENMPATTNELLKLVDDIEQAGRAGKEVQTAFGKKTASPIVSVTSSNYWSSAFQQWWSQYQGAEDYENYFWMDDGNDGRTDAGWLQYGRLESFKVMEEVLTYKNDYIDAMSSGVNYIESEKYFFNRGAAMMWMGDWLEEELEVANAQVSDDIVMIDTPVISAIVDVCSDGAFPSRYVDGFNFDSKVHRYGKLDSNGKPIDYSDKLTKDTKVLNDIDDRLSFIVKMLRTAEKPSLEEVNTAYAAAFTGGYKLTQDDLDLLYRAANYESLFASSEQWYIPSYAKAKAVAKDFLIYMATDEAIELSIKGNNTLTVFEMSDELQAKLIADQDVSPLVKERIKNVNRKITANLMINPFDYRAGLRALNENYLIESQFKDKSNYRDAYTMWELEYQKGKSRMNDWAAEAGMTKDEYQSAPYLHD